MINFVVEVDQKVSGKNNAQIGYMVGNFVLKFISDSASGLEFPNSNKVNLYNRKSIFEYIDAMRSRKGSLGSVEEEYLYSSLITGLQCIFWDGNLSLDMPDQEDMGIEDIFLGVFDNIRKYGQISEERLSLLFRKEFKLAENWSPGNYEMG